MRIAPVLLLVLAACTAEPDVITVRLTPQAPDSTTSLRYSPRGKQLPLTGDYRTTLELASSSRRQGTRPTSTSSRSTPMPTARSPRTNA